MNYKIRITAENQAIVKRIADENEMNPNDFKFDTEVYLYEIQNNKFVYVGTIQKGEGETILTTEQFIELFDKKETEWQPKRGDIVLVWDSEGNDLKERIFLIKIESAIYPIITVGIKYGNEFNNGEKFGIECYKHMKPLPIEQPKETDFKTKVIELIESENQKALVHYDESIYSRNYLDAHAYGFKSSIYKELIEKIKQL
jgi:hypothetical protein